MSFALMESRQDGSDPDVNAKIIARARKNYKIILTTHGTLHGRCSL